MYGHYGRVLQIDLTTGNNEMITPPRAVSAAGRGGRGQIPRKNP